MASKTMVGAFLSHFAILSIFTKFKSLVQIEKRPRVKSVKRMEFMANLERLSWKTFHYVAVFITPVTRLLSKRVFSKFLFIFFKNNIVGKSCALCFLDS